MLKKSITDISQFLNNGKYIIKNTKRSMMHLHEYQAQGLLKKYSVPIPKV